MTNKVAWDNLLSKLERCENDFTENEKAMIDIAIDHYMNMPCNHLSVTGSIAREGGMYCWVNGMRISIVDIVEKYINDEWDLNE